METLGKNYTSPVIRIHFSGFFKNGCLITADGSEDAEMQPEGLPGYVVPRVSFASPLNAVEILEAPTAMTNNESLAEIEELDKEFDEHGVENDTERIDAESDRDTADTNVGRSIRALYENGWHVGKIAYFNKSLKEHKIDFVDQTIDYISPHEIGGHDCLLC